MSQFINENINILIIIIVIVVNSADSMMQAEIGITQSVGSVS